MEYAREAWQWSADKARHDPLTLVLSIYMLGFFPAFLIESVHLYGQQISMFSVGEVIANAALWPLRLFGF